MSKTLLTVHDHKQIIVGWREWVALPELNIPAIKVKIDSGARTSALHTAGLRRVKKNGTDMVDFKIIPLRKRLDLVFHCQSEIVDVRNIKDSGGHAEDRFIIYTQLLLNSTAMNIEISLTDRTDMMFRMLLGRTAMAGANLIIDPARSYVHGKQLSSHYSKQNHSG